jgi:hypothetical protein
MVPRIQWRLFWRSRHTLSQLVSNWAPCYISDNVQWNLSKPNVLVASFCVSNWQVFGLYFHCSLFTNTRCTLVILCYYWDIYWCISIILIPWSWHDSIESSIPINNRTWDKLESYIYRTLNKCQWEKSQITNNGNRVY